MQKFFLKNICKYVLTILLTATFITPVFADNKQQLKSYDNKGNKILITPAYQDYGERNTNVSEKIVAIYDKKSSAYGYRYVLYTPIGHYVGHHKIMQHNPNGYGYSPIPDGGKDSKTPCFMTIKEAKHYYYPQWY